MLLQIINEKKMYLRMLNNIDYTLQNIYFCSFCSV